VLVVGDARYAGHLIESTRAGARGYLTKDHDLDTLAGAIHVIAMGGTAYAPNLTRTARTMLAPRERELLLAYVSGLTMTAAARRIGVRPSTARTYLERIKKKYAVAGRPAYTKLELAARVREDGL
jgi:two-component system, NarL family, nitrate/nitrite response regulator NarL